MQRNPARLNPAKISIKASSIEQASTPAHCAIDGSPWTRWASAWSEPQWLALDLGRAIAVKSIGISWEGARAEEFRVSVSNDGQTWQTSAHVSGKTGNDLFDDIKISSGEKIRHLRIDCLKRVKKDYGFSIYQILVNGAPVIKPSVSADKEASAAKFRNRRLPPETRAKDLLTRLTFDELLALTGGYSDFFIAPLPRFGLPAISFTDASMGVRFNNTLPIHKSVSFPAFAGLAATWNPQIAREYARSIGEECRAYGVHTLLGPGVNIYRTSTCGRNFEYLGEDPFLTSRMAVSYIKGLQSTGVMACIKHFACNNNEWIRHDVNAIVDDRTFHEIYLPSFKAAVEEADVMAFMTSYNYWNGEKASQNKALIDGVLRKELGFRNLIMSDWGAVWDGEKALSSGQDLVMPENSMVRSYIARHPERRAVIKKQLRRMAFSILKAIFKMGFYDRPQKRNISPGRFKQHEKAALATAREAITLLKNRSVLPLNPRRTKRILVTGVAAEQTPVSGGGSGYVKGYDTVTYLDALRKLGGRAVVHHKDPSDNDLKNADAVVVCPFIWEGEGSDRWFELPEDQEKLLKRAVARNNNTVVVLTQGGGVRMTGWAEQANAIVFAYYPGQTGAIALAEILFGKINPSGKLPFSIEKEFSDSPAADYLPEFIRKEHYTPHLWAYDKGKTALKEHGYSLPYDLKYKEGIFVGYRWYDRRGINPLFPFGHGISYTTFKYDNLAVRIRRSGKDPVVDLSFTVGNTGKLAGKETVQVYVNDNEASVPRPIKELKAFAKVSLKAGGKARVRLVLDRKSFAFWDPAARSWKVEPGRFNILVGASSRDIRLTGAVSLS